MDTKKKKYLQIIEINRMFFNIATFNGTMMSISSTKNKIDFFFNRVGATVNIFLVIPNFGRVICGS
jgi:cbb3-type cytochrome oxidase subunit 1